MKNANNKEIKIYIDNNDVEETYGEIINFTITQNGNYQDMYCIKSNLLTLTILTDELDLYDTSLKGLSVIVENVTDNVTMFNGVISQTPAAQPYNYEKESFTLYAVDALKNSWVSNDFPVGQYSVEEVFNMCCGIDNWVYFAFLDIDIQHTIVDVSMITDTTATKEQMMLELAKLLCCQIEITANTVVIKSPLELSNSVPTVYAQYADTNKGLNDCMQSCQIQVVEEKTTTSSSETVIDKKDYVWDSSLNKSVAWNFPLGVQLSAYDSSSVLPIKQRFGLTREPYSAWSGYVFKNKWGDGQDTSDFYSRYQPYLQHDDTGRWEGFTAEQYVSFYRYGTEQNTSYDSSCAKEIQIATDVSTISMNDERVTDARWLNGEWITVANDSSNYPLLFRSATFNDMDEWPSYDASTMSPTSTPSFKTHTLIIPPSNRKLYVGFDNLNNSYRKALKEENLSIYFTRTYEVKLQPYTLYKTKQYLLAHINLNLLCGEDSGDFNDLPLQTFWSNGNAKLNYLQREGTSYDTIFNTNSSTFAYFDDEYMWKWEIDSKAKALVNLRIYKDNTLLKSLEKQSIEIDVDNQNIFSELSEVDNVNWQTGIENSGYILAVFDANEVEGANRLEVDFLGVGDFGGRVFTNTVNFGEGQSVETSTLLKNVKELSCLQYIHYDNNPQYDNMFRSASMQYGTEVFIDKYMIDLSFEFAPGYLYEEEEEQNIDNQTDVDGNATHDFYWSQADGNFNLSFSNKLNSLISNVTKSTVKVNGSETGYLQKVNCSTYNSSQYSEVFQLATYIDQFSTPSIVLDLNCSTPAKFIDFESTRYRLVSYSYDGVRDRYKNKYIEYKDLTSIDYED